MADEPNPGTHTHKQKTIFKARQTQGVKHRFKQDQNKAKNGNLPKHKKCRLITEKKGKENSPKSTWKRINNQLLDRRKDQKVVLATWSVIEEAKGWMHMLSLSRMLLEF